MKRFLWLSGIGLLFLISTGCGDVFRPIIIPNPPTFPNPRAAHTVVSVNDNGMINPGSVMVVDVSGDTIVSVAKVGVAPVHAVQQTASQVLVVNQATTSAGADSLSKILFSGVTINVSAVNPITISLPPNSAPNFVAVAPSDTTAYVTLPGLVPDPINFPNDNAVGAVSTNSNNMVATIRVGNCPLAIVVTPDKSKSYVANNSSFCNPQASGGSINAFNTVDFSSRTINGNLAMPPIWLAARSDSQRVYVLESDGRMAFLDTSTTAGPDILTETTITVPGAAEMTYDGHLNRLYIAGGSQLAVVDVSGSSPLLVTTVAIPAFSLLNLPPVNANAVGVTALPDGSRAYVASVPSAPELVLPSQLTISSVSGDGTTATYTYTLTAGHDLTPGVTITIAGTATGFDGTFLVTAVPSGTSTCPAASCFQVLNSTSSNGTAISVSGTAAGENIFPQVTVVNTLSNTIKTTVGIAGFLPYDTLCATTRFRFAMAAAGDSSRTYLSACDGGNINVINTANDSYVSGLNAPFSARAPIPPNPQPPPQNPVFLIAGP